MTFAILKLLHILSMAIWIAGGLGYPRDVAATVALGREARAALLARLQRATATFVPAAVLTIVTGLCLMHLAGGFSHMPRRIQIALPLTISIFFVGALVVNPTIGQLQRSLEGELSIAQQKALATRFRVGITIEQVLKLVILALMVLPL